MNTTVKKNLAVVVSSTHSARVQTHYCYIYGITWYSGSSSPSLFLAEPFNSHFANVSRRVQRLLSERSHVHRYQLRDQSISVTDATS